MLHLEPNAQLASFDRPISVHDPTSTSRSDPCVAVPMWRSRVLRAEFERAAENRFQPVKARFGRDYNVKSNYLWTKSVLRVTNDKNRLTLADRYTFLLERLNLPEDQQQMVNDLRRDDFRRVHWNCAACGASYRRSVKAAVYYGLHVCPRCTEFTLHATPDRGVCAPARNATSPSDLPAGADATALPATSKARMEFKCIDCGTPYRQSVRTRTLADRSLNGLIQTNDAKDAFSRCPACRFSKFASRSHNFLDRVRYE